MEDEESKMAVLELCRMGNPILRKVAQKVDVAEIQTPAFQKLIEDMKESMEHYGGVGIAAPQIGISKQLCLIEFDGDSSRYELEQEQPLSVFINPEIEVLDESTQGFWEGCLSVPGLRGYVERPSKIKVSYIDEKAQPQTLIAEDFMAIVLQHELDHLFGKLYIDRIKDPQKLSFSEEFDEFIMPTLSEENY